MNMRWAWMLPVLASLTVTLAASSSRAQGDASGTAMMAMAPQAVDPAMLAAMQAQLYGPQVMYAPTGMAPAVYPPPGMMLAGAQAMPYMGGSMPAAYMPGPPPGAFPGPTPAMPDAYGGYGDLPTDYGMGPTDTGCPYCGGHGCDACRHLFGRDPDHDGLLGRLHHRGGLIGDVLDCVLPYQDGGCAAIRWYDFAVDFVMLTREDAGRNVALTSLGVGGPIVLQTSQLDFDYEPSFRFTGVLQAGPGSNVEFTYLGLFQFNERAFVRRSGANDLFSVFSQFGTVPPGGFPETDASDFQQITYTSTFDSFEVNFRQRWMAPNCRYQGSWLCGVRHFILDEKFRYFTSSSFNANPLNPLLPSQLQSDVDTTNNLTGVQLGGDLWICLLPGMRLGGELKAGVYGNHMNVNSTIGVNDQLPPNNLFVERLNSNDVSFIGEASLLFTYRINYQWTLRGGYQFLFVDGVALAPENFNTTPPFGPTTRVPSVNDNGDVFFHGWNIGLEFMW